MARFTAANSREMAARSVASRRTAVLQRLAEPESAAHFPSPQRPSTGEDGFAARRLCRVRQQLDLLDVEIERETRKECSDGQRLNWLVQAQTKLSEQEGRLSGRRQTSARRSRTQERENSRGEVSGFSDD